MRKSKEQKQLSFELEILSSEKQHYSSWKKHSARKKEAKINKKNEERQLVKELLQKKEKELNSIAQFAGVSKSWESEKVQSFSVYKIRAVQAQSKGLSKKSAESKVRKISCGHKKPTGLLFDNLINVEELAVIFGLAPQTIRNWVAQGKLPYVKLGKRNWFLRGSLQKWLNQKEVPQWR